MSSTHYGQQQQATTTWWPNLWGCRAPTPGYTKGSNVTEVVAFDWNNVNLKDKANCGMVKCFFDATSPSSDDNSQSHLVGYLVASQRLYADMRRASELANRLTREYGAQHFYTEHAQLVRVTPALVRTLNDLVDQPLRHIANKTINKSLYVPEEDFVVVQKVRKAPAVTLAFGSSKTKVESLPTLLPDFKPHISDPSAMAKQLAKEREIVLKALVAVPTLWRDFQGMVDVHGNFFFIDLDGHFSKKVVSERRRLHLIKNRMDKYDYMVKLLLEGTNAIEVYSNATAEW